MSITVVQHFNPSLRLLNSGCVLNCTPICRAYLECSASSGRERFRFRSLHLSCTKSYEQISRLSPSNRDKRGPKFVADERVRSFVMVIGYESRMENPEPQRCREKFRSWRLSAQAANPQNELETAEDLREQLEALQQESEQVRGRANSARLRFMRLTHVVEQLRQRAAMDVRSGKEDSARSLLIEKQKVMKALEAARQRAELLEQLAGKLNVAISMKETQLIAALSSAPLSIRSETSGDSAVHHVSPRTDGFDEEMIQSDADTDDISFTATPISDTNLSAQGDVDHNLG